MKLAWFSPLPPAHSDIANFTRRLSGPLTAAHQVRFFEETPVGFRKSDAGAEYAAPLGEVPPTLLPPLNLCDVPVYNLGNHPGFFAHTWFLNQRKPGIVVLHDLKLHHFFEGIYRERLGDQITYLRLMRQHYGSLGHEAGMAYWQQEISIDFMAEHFPMTAWAIGNALAVVVHTAHALAAVKTLTDAPVVLAPLPYPARADDEVGRRAAASPGQARIVFFGYLNVNRRLVEFLTALAAMPERGRFDVQVYGELLHRRQVETAITALGLGGHVTLHGYVAEEVLEAGLAAADLAVNLRFPSMGEASGSQLRLWDHALPSLVTRTESYADLPEDAVFFVRPEHEAADIQRHLRDLLAHPESFREAGQRGRRYLQARHQPARYVALLDGLLAHVPALRSRHSQRQLADRVGAAMAPWWDAAPRTAREAYYATAITRAV